MTHGALRRACCPVPDASAEGRAWLVSQQEWAWRVCGGHGPRQRGLRRKTWDGEQHCGGLGGPGLLGRAGPPSPWSQPVWAYVAPRRGSRPGGQGVGRGMAPSGCALLALTTGGPNQLLARVIKRRLHRSITPHWPRPGLTCPAERTVARKSPEQSRVRVQFCIL